MPQKIGLGTGYISLNPLDMILSPWSFQVRVKKEANMFSRFSYFAQNPIASPAVSEKVEASLTKMFDKYRGKYSSEKFPPPLLI